MYRLGYELGYGLGYYLRYGLVYGLGYGLEYELGYRLGYGLECGLGLICRCRIQGCRSNLTVHLSCYTPLSCFNPRTLAR